MLDSPITLLLLGISAASALASYAAARRRRARSAPPALATLGDKDLAAVLATLQSNDAPDTAQLPAQQTDRHSVSGTHSTTAIRDARYPQPVRWSEHDPEVRRRITLLVIEEIERRGLPLAPFR